MELDEHKRLFLMFRFEAGVPLPALALTGRQASETEPAIFFTRSMLLTRGYKDSNELPNASNHAHWAEQQNLVSSLTRRSKTDAWTPSVRWALFASQRASPLASLVHGDLSLQLTHFLTQPMPARIWRPRQQNTSLSPYLFVTIPELILSLGHL